LSDPFAHSGAPHRLTDACDDHEYQEDTKSAAVKENSDFPSVGNDFPSLRTISGVSG
jgi:hypothetical protein